MFHIDSGATTTIMPADDAEILGIDLDAGKKMIVRGVLGESASGYRHVVTMQFQNKQ